MSEQGEIHFFCGKMAAGKSTLALELSQKGGTVLIVEDHWLDSLYPAEISDIPSYIEYSSRLKQIMTKHVIDLLSLGLTIIFDFPGNTARQRAWFKSIIAVNNSAHTLHYVMASDEVCKNQLRQRSKNKSSGSAFTTDKEFDKITRYFEEPTESEGFNIKVYS